MGKKAETLFRITAPHFVAGFVVDPKTRRITDAAPIIRYMLGWNGHMVAVTMRKNGWRLENLAQ